jgi:small subunit ribosomal protein S21
MRREDTFIERCRRYFCERPSDKAARQTSKAIHNRRKPARRQALRRGLIAASGTAISVREPEHYRVAIPRIAARVFPEEVPIARSNKLLAIFSAGSTLPASPRGSRHLMRTLLRSRQ